MLSHAPADPQGEANREDFVKHQGVTVFLLFFGISLLDALTGGDLPRAGFWLLVGAAFWGADRMRREA